MYTHCYGHALNQAVGDAIKSIGCMQEVFDTAREICKLIKRSPKRDAKLDELRSKSKNDSRGIHAHCPTRGEALQSILKNYNELLELWDWTLQNCKDTDIKSRVRGVKSIMSTFDFIFGCELGVLLLRQTDNLSRTLQNPKLSAAEGNAIAMDVVEVLCKDRNEESFKVYWDKVVLKKEELMPARLDSGDPSNSHFPASPEESYRNIYLNAFDVTVESIRGRFNHADFNAIPICETFC